MADGHASSDSSSVPKVGVPTETAATAAVGGRRRLLLPPPDVVEEHPLQRPDEEDPGRGPAPQHRGVARPPRRARTATCSKPRAAAA